MTHFPAVRCLIDYHFASPLCRSKLNPINCSHPACHPSSRELSLSHLTHTCHNTSVHATPPPPPPAPCDTSLTLRFCIFGWLFADFRISKYCDEHLIIGNEDQWERRRPNEERDVSGDATSEDNESPSQKQQQHHDSSPSPGPGSTATAGRNYYNDNANDPVGFAEDRRQRNNQWSYDDEDDGDSEEYDTNEYDGYDGPRGEPRAEALQQQPLVQQMHSFHNLKILKTFPSEQAPINETEHQRKLEAEAAYRKRQKVFSQVSAY